MHFRHRQVRSSFLCLLGITATAAAHVEIVYANRSGTSGSYEHALTLLDGSGAERPLAQLRPPSPVLLGSPTTGGTIRRPIPVDLGGARYHARVAV